MRGKGRIWFSIVLSMLCSCRAVEEYSGVDGVSISNTTLGHVARDSVFVKDSIIVRERTDTVFFTKYRTFYKEKIVKDTLFVCDTLYKERVVTRYVNNGNKGNKGWWLLLLLLLPLFFPGIVRRFIDFIRNA
ncbi:MAG: hypothetical protein J6R07_02825 [Bacteroidaceae bacterium]|nr:hypothetical protein [Bacteroidaceae bacterium]